MSKLRKEFQFDPNEYERPEQSWICGWASDGTPCPRGPDGNGNCGAICTPYKVTGASGNEGDRWFCANASLQGGKCDVGPMDDGSCSHQPPLCEPSKSKGEWVCNRGKCDAGPLPDGSCCQQFAVCQPVRSVMSARRYVAFAAFAMAIGVALLLMAGSSSNQSISPGELTSHHSANSTCADCHTVGMGNLKDWLHQAVAFTHDNQSRLCLDCHTNLQQKSMHPHGVDPQELQVITDRLAESGFPSDSESLLMTSAKTTVERDEWACATCHHEHRGRTFDLTQMSDRQCQTCHSNTFHSFEQGHPDFTSYPYSRRTRIYFDHTTHYGRHFAVYKRLMRFGRNPSSCYTCHEPDASGGMMLTRGFEASCASCHEGQIEESPMPGLTILAIPGLDLEKLDPTRIGEWPAPSAVEARGTDGRLPALMELLLSADPDYERVAKVLQNVNLRFLEDADEPQLEAVTSYVWIIKELVYDLIHPGDQLEKRLTQALGPDVPEDQVHTLAHRLHHQTIVSAQQEWFPSLSMEWKTHRDGEPLPTGKETEGQIASGNGSSTANGMGWYIEATERTVRYRANGHADEFMRGWIDVVVARKSHSRGSVERMYQLLATPFSTGRCLKCHTIDRPRATPVVNWFAAPPTRKFTRFGHVTHFNAVGGDGCAQCHILNEKWERYPSQFVNENGLLRVGATEPHANFHQMTKTDCARCHQAGAARQDCLTCHRYHVGDTSFSSMDGQP